MLRSDCVDAQTAWMRMLIWVFAVRKCPNTLFSHGAAQLGKNAGPVMPDSNAFSFNTDQKRTYLKLPEEIACYKMH